MRAKTPPTQRIWGKFLVGDECWEWIGATGGNGYGKISAGPGSLSPLWAHRVVYEALMGAVPEGLHLDHLCRNPPCVRPDHLEPVTHAMNMARKPRPTHCKMGHPYNETNMGIKKNRTSGSIFCRECGRTRWRKPKNRQSQEAPNGNDTQPTAEATPG